ncbi:BTAD domain-containing putative transcriptional regulator [Pseudoruegeria sp. HB172150]|uniref:AfsR/SARP family transcriptional regulator n=1 Tax=Pseudoruegeria sp. HB172150 TaxID=2721164 RepID=UPI00155674F2|nr:BTAD domain-containing putative transcriptional regulator [Pseudoruegeria sp. HB172150]
MSERNRMQIRLLGDLELSGETGCPVRMTSRRCWGLLAYLVQSAGRPVPRQELAEMFWPKRSPGQARASLRQELAVLRKALREAGLDAIRASNTVVTFVADPAIADCRALEVCVASGEDHDLSKVAQIYRGPFLQGLTLPSQSFSAWQSSECNRLQAIAVGALKQLLESEQTTGNTRAAMGAVAALLAVDPGSEQAHRVWTRARKATPKCAIPRETAFENIAALEPVEVCLPDATGIPGDPHEAAVLIACLPELSAFDPGIDPGVVLHAQAAFADFARRTVEGYDGTVLPGPGDRVVAVFDGGEAEEQAERAGLVALILTAEPVAVQGARPISVLPAAAVARGLVVRSGDGAMGLPLLSAARTVALAQTGEALADASFGGLSPVDWYLTAAEERAGLYILRTAEERPAIVTRPPQLPVLWQSWRAALTRGDLALVLALGEQVRSCGGRDRAIGDVMVGASRFFRGRLAAAEEALLPVEDLYLPDGPPGLDPGMVARSLLAWTRVLRGRTAASGETVRRVLSEAQGLGCADTALWCRLFAALVQGELGAARVSLALAQTAAGQAQGQPLRQALARAIVARARDRLGEPDAARQLAGALGDYRRGGGTLAVPMIHAWLADAALSAGGDDALLQVDEGLAAASATGVLHYEPELLRLQAQLLIRNRDTRAGQAEAAFLSAVEAARRTGSGLHELRASVGFAAYLRQTGRARDAALRLDRGLEAVDRGASFSADIRTAQALRQRLAVA